MAISMLSSNSGSIYTVLDPSTSTDAGTDAVSGSGTTDTGETEAADVVPALAGSSNALQSLFALASPASGETASLVSSVVNAALNAPSSGAVTMPSTFGIDPASLASVSQPDASFTTSATNTAATTGSATGVATGTGATASASSASTSLSSDGAGSTTTVNSDGSTTTTTINPDGSVSVETSPATSSASSSPTGNTGVDDSYLAYLTLPSIPIDNSVDYSDGG